MDVPVIGERFVTPGAIVQLVFKLRLRPPVTNTELSNGALSDVEKEKQDAKFNDEHDQIFLVSKKDFEDLPAGEPLSGWAHAPRWPVVSACYYFRLRVTHVCIKLLHSIDVES